MKYTDLFLFKGIPTDQIEEICKHFPQTVKFKKGDVIYSKTDFRGAIGFIISGNAFAVSNNQSEIFLNKFEKNMCFGAAAVFGGGENYVSTVIAKTDAEILFITEEQLERIFKSYPQTAINYIAFLSDKVRFLNTKLCVISCASAEDTLLKYLSTVADAEGYAQIPKSMTLLSKMLGVSRASLYRALDTLTENGNIIRENNKYRVIENEKVN